MIPTENKPTNPKDIVGQMKVPMSVVPGGVLAEVAVAMLEGKCQYGSHNYRVGEVRASIYYDANFRHIMDWWEGTDIDPPSGLHHVIKAIASLIVLRDSMLQGTFYDDRPVRGNNQLGIPYSFLNSQCATIIAKYSNLSPTHYTQKLYGNLLKVIPTANPEQLSDSHPDYSQRRPDPGSL